jgi:DNA-binding winged helix-turn-helix (wHTH) protein
MTIAHDRAIRERTLIETIPAKGYRFVPEGLAERAIERTAGA